MKKLRKRIMKLFGISLVIIIFGAAFIYLQGIQYTLALVTNSWDNPYFHSSQITPEANCKSAPVCTSGPIRVLTYNVLCRVCTAAGDKPAEGYETWDVRLPHLQATVRDHNPDLIGFQELGGWEDVNELNPDPARFIPLSHKFGPWIYADACIMYRSDRFEAVEFGTFWLSPNPSLPFGFGWEPLSMPRYVIWVHLRQKDNGFEFLYMNTHFDNGSLNKEPSAVLVHDTFKEHAKRLPIIFSGDFNTQYDTARYHNLQYGTFGEDILFENAADLVAQKEEFLPIEGLTPNQTGTPIPDIAHIIDHIFLAGPAEKKVNRWIVDRRGYDVQQAKHQSDHPAVFAEIEFNLR